MTCARTRFIAWRSFYQQMLPEGVNLNPSHTFAAETEKCGHSETVYQHLQDVREAACWWDIQQLGAPSPVVSNPKDSAYESEAENLKQLLPDVSNVKRRRLLSITRLWLPSNAPQFQQVSFALKVKQVVFVSPTSIFQITAPFASVWMCFASFSHQRFYYTCSNKLPLKRGFILILSSCILWEQIKVTKERWRFSSHMRGITM